MDKVQQAVGAYILVEPKSSPPNINRVHQGKMCADYGVVVSSPDEYAEVQPGDGVYFNAADAIQVGNYLAIKEKWVIAKETVAPAQSAAAAVADDSNNEFDLDFAEAPTTGKPIGWMETTPARAGLYAEVEDERQYQEALWGQASDDKNTETNWKVYIADYLHGHNRAEKYRGDFRKRMVKVAALALAAVEAFDRTNIPLDCSAAPALAA